MIEFNRYFALSLLTAAPILGCDVDDAPAQERDGRVDADDDAFIADVPEDLVSEAAVDEGDAVLARLEAPGGATITFIDESLEVPGGGIGMLELSSGKSVIGHYGAEHQATPLEVFMALAPGVEPPERLYEDHVIAAKKGLAVPFEPRQFPGPRDLTDALDPVAELPESECDAHDYHTWFVANDGSLPSHGHGHNLTGSNTAQTGFSSERYLGVCVLSTFDVPEAAVLVKIEFEFSAGLWSLVSGSATWVHWHSGIHYHSSGLVNYRYRVVVTEATADGYDIEGSW